MSGQPLVRSSSDVEPKPVRTRVLARAAGDEQPVVRMKPSARSKAKTEAAAKASSKTEVADDQPKAVDVKAEDSSSS